MPWLQLLTLPVLGMIAWEDLRERSIHWWWLPLLAAALVIPVWRSDDHFTQVGFNLAFLGLQLGATFLVLILRHGAWVNPLEHYIGLGDLLFFLVLALGLGNMHFILFLISGLALCVPAYFLLIRIRPSTQRSVPTAGFLALYLMLWIGLDLAGLVPSIGSLAQLFADA